MDFVEDKNNRKKNATQWWTKDISIRTLFVNASQMAPNNRTYSNAMLDNFSLHFIEECLVNGPRVIFLSLHHNYFGDFEFWRI